MVVCILSCSYCEADLLITKSNHYIQVSLLNIMMSIRPDCNQHINAKVAQSRDQPTDPSVRTTRMKVK